MMIAVFIAPFTEKIRSSACVSASESMNDGVEHRWGG